MRCPGCGVEMMIYETRETEHGREAVYVCRNRQCRNFDDRLVKKTEPAAEQTEA
ncbi:MAG: hypothetical protein MJ074_06690 [Oscillospiraceae bacterium]|nr:hypothetical protein [Oscillospiraceae bacterium]